MIDFKKQRLLVIAPHPDDEVIGCGGLIKKIKDAGGKVYVLFLTVGNTKDFTKKGRSTISQRLKELERVAKFLKFDNYHLALPGDQYHLQLDKISQKTLIDLIERKSEVAVEKVKPTIVAFTSPKSYNQDHRTIAFAAHAALRPEPQNARHFVNTVLSYEETADQWSLEANPEINFFVPLSKTEMVTKMKALQLYKSQLRPAPNLRSIEALTTLAKLRGAQSGNMFAEGFVCLRTII